MELERSGDELGKSVWIYVVEPESGEGQVKRMPIREVTWILADEEDDYQLAVSAYAARPQKPQTSARQELEVTFGEFKVSWK